VAQFNHDSDKSSELKEMKQVLENNPLYWAHSLRPIFDADQGAINRQHFFAEAMRLGQQSPSRSA